MKSKATPPYLEVDDEDRVWLVVDPTLPGGSEMDYESFLLGSLPDLDFDLVPDEFRAEAELLKNNYEPPEDLRGDDLHNFYNGLSSERW